MDLEKKDSSKNIDNNGLEKENAEEYYYLVDSKNILKTQKIRKISQNLEKFFNVQIEYGEEDLINQSTNSSMTNSLGNINLETNSQKLLNIFTEKVFPKCNLDGFSICKKISAQFFKKNTLDKNKLEDCVNYIYSQNQQYTYDGIINLDINIIQNIGYILMVSYNKLGDFKIYDKKALKTNIKRIEKDGQDVIQDFLKYCNKKNCSPERYKKTSYWEKHSENFYLPGIFIFLLNSLNKVGIINLDFTFFNDLIIRDEDIDYFSLIIYNIQYIFNNIEYVKINLVHTKFQCNIFSKYYEEYLKALNENNREIKKRYLNLNSIYEKKWDFKAEFLLDEYRKMHKSKNKKEREKISHINKVRLSNLNETKNETKINIKSRPKIFEFFLDIKSNLQRLSIQSNLGENLFKNNNFNENEEEGNEEEDEQYCNNNPDIVYKKKNRLEDNLNILKLIILSFNAINRFNSLCKLDLIINDSYSPELNNYFENEIFDQENKSVNLQLLKDFHLIDIISNKFLKINTLNLELNSLDSITFKKVLEAIFVNNFSLSLYISFFSSNITYSPQSLYRLYSSLKDNSLNIKKFRGDLESRILDKLLEDFSTNMNILFNLIKYKSTKMQILGFNFDVPDIVENKQKYSMVIMKFILSILLYITKKGVIIQKTVILAPKIKFNNDLFPFIDKLLGEINNNDNNKILKLQLQLYKVINITNIVSDSLVVLCLGDCDLYTFKELVKHLTSYQFSSRSSLSKLSLSLIKSLKNLTKVVYSLFFKLFNIKIKQLEKLNLYTNIIISHTKEYIYLLNIFNNNWISSSILTLNKKSEEIYKLKKCQEEKNKLKYLVPGCLERDLLTPEEVVLKKKINNQQKINYNDEAFWYLKYMFQIRYSCIDNDKKNRAESLSKFLANNILSYIHFQKSMIVKHNLDENDFKE